jgi:hypothetical protein
MIRERMKTKERKVRTAAAVAAIMDDCALFGYVKLE